MVQLPIYIYFKKSRIILKLIYGAMTIVLAVTAFLSLGNTGNETANENDIKVFYFAFMFLMGGLIIGGMIIAINLYRLLMSRKPQVTLSEQGIEIGDYLAFGTIAWHEIAEIKLQNVESLSSGSDDSKEQAICIMLTSEKAKKVFDNLALIKTQYLDCEEKPLLDAIVSLWKRNKGNFPVEDQSFKVE